MPYRSSTAGFERVALPPLAGILPASFLASATGTGLTFAGYLVAFATSGEQISVNGFLASVLILVILAIPVMAVAAVFCMIFMALIGVPIAWMMGRRLETRIGLLAAVALPIVAGAALGTSLQSGLLGIDPPWAYLAIMLAYALPAGLIYRRSVLTARSLDQFAGAQRTA
jgi:hypothetical protein